MHVDVVVDREARHVARHVRRDGDGIAVRVRIVGALLIARREPPDEPADDEQQRDRAEDDQRLAARPLAFAAVSRAIAVAAGAAAAIVVRMPVSTAAARCVGVALAARLAVSAAGSAAAAGIVVAGTRDAHERAARLAVERRIGRARACATPDAARGARPRLPSRERRSARRRDAVSQAIGQRGHGDLGHRTALLCATRAHRRARGPHGARSKQVPRLPGSYPCRTDDAAAAPTRIFYNDGCTGRAASRSRHARCARIRPVPTGGIR
ncbi:hypothetical protein FEP58_06047 [Burkholderia multivorans]|nr:hypothetical protein [Burkholderia multivorans]